MRTYLIIVVATHSTTQTTSKLAHQLHVRSQSTSKSGIFIRGLRLDDAVVALFIKRNLETVVWKVRNQSHRGKRKSATNDVLAAHLRLINATELSWLMDHIISNCYRASVALILETHLLFMANTLCTGT